LLLIAKKSFSSSIAKKWHSTAAPNQPDLRNGICKTFDRSVKKFAKNLLRKLLFLQRTLKAKRLQKSFQSGLAMIPRGLADASRGEGGGWIPFLHLQFYDRSVKNFACAGEGSES
jgi:hypothetical protein